MTTDRSSICPGCHRDVPVIVLKDTDHYAPHANHGNAVPTLKSGCALSRQPVQMVNTD